jgi:hypothetical protein
MAGISNYITINGYTLPTPISYEVQRSDLDSSETNRSESGYLHRNRLREGVYKVIATWRLTVSQLKDVTNALSPAEFSATFIDLTTFSYHTTTMYAGDRTASVVRSSESVGELLVDFSVNIIEY